VVEFQKAFPSDYSKLIRSSSQNQPGVSEIDLWEANKLILLEAGLLDDNIEVAGICTYDHSDVFYSHRKDVKCGRFAAGIVLRK
jgi:polyphenol oxidase